MKKRLYIFTVSFFFEFFLFEYRPLYYFKGLYYVITYYFKGLYYVMISGFYHNVTGHVSSLECCHLPLKSVSCRQHLCAPWHHPYGPSSEYPVTRGVFTLLNFPIHVKHLFRHAFTAFS